MTQEKAEKLVIEAGGKVEDLWEWMRGQTCGLIDGVPDFYDYDIERFIRYKCNPKNEPIAEFD